MDKPADMTIIWILLLAFLVMIAGALSMSFIAWRREEDEAEQRNRDNHERMRSLRWKDGMWYHCNSDGCGDGNGNQQS